VHEKWEHGVPGAGALAVSPLGDRVFMGGSPREMYVLDVEPGECEDLPPGLANFYPVDGSFHDAKEKAHLTPVGQVRFVPGKVGQAVRLEGKGSLEASLITHYRFGRGDSTLAFYVKVAGGPSEQGGDRRHGNATSRLRRRAEINDVRSRRRWEEIGEGLSQGASHRSLTVAAQKETGGFAADRSLTLAARMDKSARGWRHGWRPRPCSSG
ncbi:MAG: hypothetical protein ACKV22_28735, partial [Bryobacteraceae bacterium]